MLDLTAELQSFYGADKTLRFAGNSYEARLRLRGRCVRPITLTEMARIYRRTGREGLKQPTKTLVLSAHWVWCKPNLHHAIWPWIFCSATLEPNRVKVHAVGVGYYQTARKGSVWTHYRASNAILGADYPDNIIEKISHLYDFASDFNGFYGLQPAFQGCPELFGLTFTTLPVGTPGQKEERETEQNDENNSDHEHNQDNFNTPS